MKGTLIFDYDGTLHQSMAIYEPSMRTALAFLSENHLADVPEVSSERISSWLGLTYKEMWDSFLPDLAPELKQKAADIVADHIIAEVKAHRALWFEGIKESLTQLKKAGYEMVILSNCRQHQADAHWEAFHMDRWFKAFYNCESFGGFVHKSEIVRQVVKKHPGPFIMVGDRSSDREIAESIGAPFVGCLYGFGSRAELEGAAMMINDPADLVEIDRLSEHKKFMKEALRQAKKAEALEEVPIGCVIVKDGKIIARGYNRRNTDRNTLSHAELNAIRRASKRLGDWRLEGCTMYITLEPCQMCAGALVQSRMDRIVIGSMNPKAGCAGSVMNLLQVKEFNHQVDILEDVLHTECSSMLTEFFRRLRNKNKNH